MFDFLRLFPRRPLLVSAAGWAFFFAIQVGYLTYVMSERYVPSSEPRPYDRLWFVYTQLPRMLPMAAIYAGCAVLVSQILGRFTATDNPDNLTIAQWRELLKDNPAKTIARLIPILVAVLVPMVLLVDLLTNILSVKVSYILLLITANSWGLLLFYPWLNWIARWETSPPSDDRRDAHTEDIE